MKLNTKPDPIKTHEGAVAQRTNPELQLRRAVMACMLWENSFYEDSVSIADRIKSLVLLVNSAKVSAMAIEARTQMKLRHVPLLLCRELATLGKLKADTLNSVIQRADELAEFLAIYWQDGRCPLSAQVKKGLAKAFIKFNAYQLAKYNRGGQIKLRDVLFLCHAKPEDDGQAQIWKKLINGTLESPDTWEVNLSAGKDKKESFERLLSEKKLGGLALLRNLRNMAEAKVDEKIIIDSLENMKVDNILPFRFIAAARYAPQWESAIEKAMFKSTAELPKLSGKTVILIDVSGSMDSALSSKSDMTRIDAACGVGICAREICETVDVLTFSEQCVRVPARRGFALRDACKNSQCHSSTMLGSAMKTINNKIDYDRIIVITDEQSHDSVPAPKGKGYMINVSSERNGIGYGQWTHLDGFSESVLNYIKESEGSFNK